MAPEIIANNNIIADVPDKTGIYNTLKGSTIYVNTDLIDADAKKQIIILESDEIGGRRKLGLTQQGIGNSNDRKRGDKKDPEVSVSLLDRPIRITYRRTEWVSSKSLGDPSGGQYKERKETYKNPRWTRGNGQR